MRKLLKITSNHGKTSYLFGTIHVNTKEVSTLPVEVETAFNSATTYVGENDFEGSTESAMREWNEKYGREQRVRNHEGYSGEASNELKKFIYSLRKILPWYMYAVLLLTFYIQEFRNGEYDLETRVSYLTHSKLEQEDRITTYLLWIISNFTTQTFLTSYMIRRYPPLLLWDLLLRNILLGHLTHNCLDMQLRTRAIESNKNVRGFQTRGEIARAAMATDILTYEEQMELLNYRVNQLPSSDMALHQLIKKYVSQDITNQPAYGPLNEQDDRITALRQRYHEAILHNRDKIMANKMQSYLCSGNAFFAVGCAHLEGIQAIIVSQGHAVEEIVLSEFSHP